MADEVTPSQKIEKLSVEAEEALRNASEYEARGWAGMAQASRNEARGKKSAATRIAKREGWI